MEPLKVPEITNQIPDQILDPKLSSCDKTLSENPDPDLQVLDWAIFLENASGCRPGEDLKMELNRCPRDPSIGRLPISSLPVTLMNLPNILNRKFSTWFISESDALILEDSIGRSTSIPRSALERAHCWGILDLAYLEPITRFGSLAQGIPKNPWHIAVNKGPVPKAPLKKARQKYALQVNVPISKKSKKKFKKA